MRKNIRRGGISHLEAEGFIENLIGIGTKKTTKDTTSTEETTEDTTTTKATKRGRPRKTAETTSKRQKKV